MSEKIYIIYSKPRVEHVEYILLNWQVHCDRINLLIDPKDANTHYSFSNVDNIIIFDTIKNSDCLFLNTDVLARTYLDGIRRSNIGISLYDCCLANLSCSDCIKDIDTDTPHVAGLVDFQTWSENKELFLELSSWRSDDGSSLTFVSVLVLLAIKTFLKPTITPHTPPKYIVDIDDTSVFKKKTSLLIKNVINVISEKGSYSKYLSLIYDHLVHTYQAPVVMTPV